ncbi:esterase/lipase family protein [Erythrobacter ani]|uniref:Alpha/beta hydrolase n=1 Tax=Erythrobacter ani TaxID=2827235 RepID=A0ABS6SNC1_9SPHN|nr:alpha/beta hydrolase [Erythrobacter ani]MBV7266531.1 alpha/beta hydrolase [Erythrobacter ani]
MSTRERFPDLPKMPKLPLGDGELARRIELAREPEPEPVSRPTLWRMASELQHLAEPFRRPFRTLNVEACDNPQIVLILPGFATSASRMRYMARQIERARHKAKRWKLGWNWGPSDTTLDRLSDRLDEVFARYDRPAVLLGWSLGGLYARELAKRKPELVSKVITMGTPFSGSPRANNVWRLYQFVTGHRVDKPPVEGDFAVKPPVETVALWSPNDGAIAPRSAAGYPGERDRAIALRCTHMGFSYSPEAIQAVLSELRRC